MGTYPCRQCPSASRRLCANALLPPAPTLFAALKAGKPVLCSCNLPGGTPLLQAVAERRLIRELADMGLPAGGAAAAGGGATGAAGAGLERTPAPATPELSERVAGLKVGT